MSCEGKWGQSIEGVEVGDACGRGGCVAHLRRAQAILGGLVWEVEKLLEERGGASVHGVCPSCEGSDDCCGGCGC